MLRIKYNASVKTPAGWRHVYIVADAEKISAGMAIVNNVVLIDGEQPGYGQSRTGARRQEFNGLYFAKIQIGAKKRLSACTIMACETA